MTQISDYTHYTTLMKNGFMDKLFFIDKIGTDWKTLLDYGCADGFLTKMLGKIFPDKQIHGTDENRQMIESAKYAGERLGNVSFDVNPKWDADVVFLCSVLHEVFSYWNDNKAKEVLQQLVSHPNRKFIVIRDMCFNDQEFEDTYGSHALADKIRHYCAINHLGGELNRFELQHGPIKYPKFMHHFMLKYMYTNSPNWSREVIEDYVSFSTSKHLRFLLNHEKFHVIHRLHYQLPYLHYKWSKDFGTEGAQYNKSTHVQLILERI